MARMRQAARQASRLWKLPLMQWKAEQNRHLARMAGLEASRLWKLVLMLWKVEQNRHLARRRQAARQAAKAPEQAREDTSPAKIDVTRKSPVGDMLVVTLIGTDTTLDHSQKAEKV